ncbi:MAG: hypothetical protein EOP54_29535 [Sphingobacteriales bacterium]|nr:MAG: hypothetical protein EOP54_29535 [Sphingobacteriales bacterium]
MNTTLLQAIALILLGVCTVAAQDRYIYNDTVMKQSKFIVGADVRFATFDTQNNFYDNDVLNNGMSYDVSMYYKVNKHVAIGLKYNLFTAADTYQYLVADGLGNVTSSNVKEDVTLSYIGLSVRLDASKERKPVHFYAEESIGYFHYSQDIKGTGSAGVTYGGLGFLSVLGLEFRLFKDFYLGPKAGIAYGIGSKKSNYSENGGEITHTGSGLDNSFFRLEAGAGASYRF